MEHIITLAQKFPDYGFTTNGSGTYASALKEAGVYNIPHLKRDQIAAFLQSLDLFILPASETDPFGLVVLEAMAAGCPVLITNKVGVADYLNKSEVEICDENQLAETLEKTINDKSRLEELKINGKKAVERFSFEKMLNDYLKVIDSGKQLG